MIHAKRIYDPAEPKDGTRILVDRLWPRGVKKESAHLDDWMKSVAPSDALRRWFGHDPAKWEEFRRRYTAELDANPEDVEKLLLAIRKATVTLLFSAKDPEHNNAAALRGYLEKVLERRPTIRRQRMSRVH